MSDYQINEESTKGKYSLEEEMKKSEYIVLLFQRDYFCTNCRTQVQRIEERYEEFQKRNTQVVSILPENLSRSKDWSDKYDLSYPVIADVNSEISDRFEQPVRFGALGNIHDLLGRMPLVIILSCSNNDLDVVFRKAGSNPSDRPTVDDLLQEIDADD